MRKMRAPVREHYVNQVRLLLGVLPEIAAEEVFALKGGTAINLFYRDMPRLSVDVDLTHLPTVDQDTALKDMDRRLDRITKATTGRKPRLHAKIETASDRMSARSPEVGDYRVVRMSGTGFGGLEHR